MGLLRKALIYTLVRINLLHYLDGVAMVSEKKMHLLFAFPEVYDDLSISSAPLPDMNSLIMMRIPFFIAVTQIPENEMIGVV